MTILHVMAMKLIVRPLLTNTRLSHRIDVNTRDYLSRTALHLAVFNGHVGIVRLLLDSGVNIDSENLKGDTALHTASYFSSRGFEEIVKLLLKGGISVNYRNRHGETALHRAAENGCAEVVRILLENGAYVNARDLRGMTALHHSTVGSYCGCDSVMRIFLENGADIGTRGHEARAGTSREQAAIVGLLLQYGASVDVQDTNGVTPLSKAVMTRSSMLVRMLLDAGASPEVPERFGVTPLTRASALSDNEEVFTLLQRNTAVG